MTYDLQAILARAYDFGTLDDPNPQAHRRPRPVRAVPQPRTVCPGGSRGSRLPESGGRR